MRHPTLSKLRLKFCIAICFLALTAGATLQARCAPEPGTDPKPEFHFTTVDLDLLRQVNGFDKYIEERGWVYSDSNSDAYVEKLGLSLVPAETPENVKWRFKVLRDVEANAFALPNGSIYINSELISRMDNEAQLAGVLAHEITHVVNRHSYLENRSARKKTVAIDVMLAAASAAYYAGVNPAITNAMSNLLPMIVAETIFGYSRILEHEADAYAVESLHRRGYDIGEYARALDLLRNGPEVELSKEPFFWASHPKLASRVVFVRERAAELQPSTGSFLVNESPYHLATMGILRHNADLAILLGRPRTALASALKLVNQQSGDPDNYVLLGDAYRSLGARTPVPQPDELTDEAKDAARRRMKKMTIAEYDSALLAEPQGPSHLQSNFDHAVEALHRALSLDPQHATAHRGLGFLFERESLTSEAIVQFEKYLELAPQAKDARQVRTHLKNLESPAHSNTSQVQTTPAH